MLLNHAVVEDSVRCKTDRRTWIKYQKAIGMVADSTLRNYNVSSSSVVSKNISSFLKRLLKYFSCLQLHICMRPDFPQLLQLKCPNATD